MEKRIHDTDAEPRAAGAEPRAAGDRAAFLGRLAAGLAHEIKNPLSTMSINLALLEEEWQKAAQVRNPAQPEPTARERRCMKRVQTLQNEVRRLGTIVEDFLRYAKGGEVNRAPLDLVALVRGLLAFVELEDSQLAIRHHVDLPASLPMAMLDESAIKQAVLNLLVNARQAMPDGGELLVRLRRSGNYAELTITDTGVGIEERDLERCFDEYFSNKKGGTGLGLATTRRIIEEHSGTIDVVSEPGRGTSFTIVVPLLVELYSSKDPHRGSVDAGARNVEVEELSSEAGSGEGTQGPGRAGGERA